MGTFNVYQNDNKTPNLNRTIAEDFSFNGKSTKGSLLYSQSPKGRKIPDSAFSTLPLNNARCAVWSPSGRYLAVGHNGGTFLSVYYFDGTNFTKLTSPASLPTAVVMAIEWSPKEDFFITVEYATPFFSIYNFDTSSGSPVITRNTTTTGTSVYTSNGSTPIDVSLSSNGKYLAVAQFTSPYIRVWNMSGSLSTALADPTQTPGSAARSCAWSPNGRYLAVTSLSSPYVTVYNFNGTTLTKLSVQPDLPPDTAYGVSWSPNGAYLAVSHFGGTRVSVHSFRDVSNGSYFGFNQVTLETMYGDAVPLQNPATTTISDNAFYSGDGLSSNWSPDGRYFAQTLESAPFVRIFSVQSDYSLVLHPDSSTQPGGKSRTVMWTPDGRYLAVAHTTTPGCSVYASTTGDIKPGFMLDIEPPSNAPHV